MVPPRYSALSEIARKGRSCSEIYYDEGTAVFGMSRHSVDYPVRTHLLRIIVFHYDAGLDAGAYDDSLSIEIFERKMLQCVKHRRNDC